MVRSGKAGGADEELGSGLDRTACASLFAGRTLVEEKLAGNF